MSRKRQPTCIITDSALNPGKRAVEEMDIDRIYDLTRPGAYTVYLDKKFGPGPNETKSNEITFTIIK
jgi:hypothetical protein